MSSPTNQLPDLDALWNYDRPAESEKAFLEVLEKIEALEDVPPAYRLELLTQIGHRLGCLVVELHRLGSDSLIEEHA